MIEFLRYLVPNQTQIEWGSMSALAGTAFTYFCGWSGAVEALLWLMVIDYISGVMAAYVNPNLALNSQRGFKGIIKKMMILLLVSLAHFVDKAVGQILVQTIVIWFFIGNEGLSIVENSAKAGLPVPEKLKATPGAHWVAFMYHTISCTFITGICHTKDKCGFWLFTSERTIKTTTFSKF